MRLTDCWNFLFIRLVPMNLMDMINISAANQTIYEKEAGFCYGNGVS